MMLTDAGHYVRRLGVVLMAVAVTAMGVSCGSVSHPKVSELPGADTLQGERMQVRRRLKGRIESLPCKTNLDHSALEHLAEYFDAELKLWKDYPLNPSVKPNVVRVADYGSKGDGKTDDAPAFREAVSAVRAFHGKPTVLEVPAGTFYFSEVTDAGVWGSRSGLDLGRITNCVVRGVSRDKTHLVFGCFNEKGISFTQSRNSTLQDMSVSLSRTPFAQGTVVAFDRQEGFALYRHHVGTMSPTDPEFARTKQPQVCGIFLADGSQQWQPGPIFFDNRAEDLGGGLYRVYFDKKQSGYARAVLPVGAVLVLPCRLTGLKMIDPQASEFCNFVRVDVLNSREAAINAFGAAWVSAKEVRVRPKSSDLLLSSNADAFFNSPGTYIADCEFINMNDDGANCHDYGSPVLSVKGRSLVSLQLAGRHRQGDRLQIVDPLTGAIRAEPRIDHVEVRRDDKGRAINVFGLSEDLPKDIVSAEIAGELTPEVRLALTHENTTVVRIPDTVYAPESHGVGFIVRNTRFANLRGCGVNSQCSHTLIEGCEFENVQTSIKVTGLLQWYEGSVPHDIEVKNCRFCNTVDAVCSHYKTINNRIASVDPITDVRLSGNRYVNVLNTNCFFNAFRILDDR